jgi:hypothetical protein
MDQCDSKPKGDQLLRKIVNGEAVRPKQLAVSEDKEQ